MQLKSPRTFLEVRVGDLHSAEVILHVRRDDIPWFNSRGQAHAAELFALLQTSILPRMFGDEVEESHAAKTSDTRPPKLGPGGIPIESIGEKNKAADETRVRAKRKRLTKKQIQSMEAEKECEQSNKTKDVYYAFGENILLAYRLEEAKKNTYTTLVVPKGFKKQRHLQELHKLSKRIVLYCYKHDPEGILESEPPGGGFPRPDMIPMSNIFREPKFTEE